MSEQVQSGAKAQTPQPVVVSVLGVAADAARIVAGPHEFVPPRLVRAPLLGVAAAFAAGIVAGRYAPVRPGLWLALAGAMVAAAIVTFRREHLHLLTAAAVLVCAAALGAARANVAYYSVAEDDIATYTPRRPILATVRGQIVTCPAISDSSTSMRFGYKRGPGTSFVLAAGQIHAADRWLPVSGLARVTIGQADDRLTAGQEVELVCRMARPQGTSNPGQFDASDLARRTHVLTQIAVPGSDGVTILADRDMPWYASLFWNFRAAARQHLSGCGDEETAPLMNTLIIGDRQPALDELNRQMVRTGVAHFLSISGMHLAVFLGFVYVLCRLLTLTPRRSAWAALVVLVAYMLLAKANAPLLRSAVMAAAVCAAVIVRRGSHSLNALAFAAVALLAIDPMELFSGGFQLSFLTVGGLIVLQAPIREAIFGTFLRRRGLMVFRDAGRVQRWLYHSGADWLMSATAMCLAAYVTSAPLAAYHFGFFSPYAPLLSLLLSPLITAVLIPGYLSMALALPMPNLSYAMGRLSSMASGALSAAVDATTQLPGADFQMREAPVWWVFLCYGVIAVIWQRRGIRYGRVWAAGALVALVAATAWTQRPAPAPREAELHLLSVGDGQCAILRTAAGRSVVFDAGTRNGFDAYESTVAPFFRHMRFAWPRVAFVSHANTDHYAAVPGLIEHGLRRVYVNDYFGNGQGPEAREAKALLKLLEGGGVEVVRLRAGDTVELDDRTKVDVLWPPREARDDLAGDANENSLVLRVTCGGRSLLLPGDIMPMARAQLAAGSGLRADVLIAPHHGSLGDERSSRGPMTQVTFFDAVSPEVVLVSRGRETLAPQDLAAERREFYDKMKSTCRYYSTPLNGWIRVTLGQETLDVKTMR